MDVSKDTSMKMTKMILEAVKDPKSKEENGGVTQRAIAKYVDRGRRPAFNQLLSARINQLVDQGLLVKVGDGHYMLPNPKAPENEPPASSCSKRERLPKEEEPDAENGPEQEPEPEAERAIDWP
ncbi:hypothetical protein RJ639_021270 [Escallonia herrerae]|uniref:H15 domain-containing protein n=1 Tax=Escallonia herrerae TaxID=1293975 RepID=A0AA88V4I8_9ASTE|nr:hypothetical protein RJ639_021270 [Escallonia herrerae]